MPKIRPTVRGFGHVAPGGGAAVGAALQDVGQALGSFAELRTNLELFDIREQEQIDRLEQAQFEKVERSEAIVQLTAKQIAMNEAAEQILVEAKKARNYGNVQGQMKDSEDNYIQDLFEGRSQHFRDIFESMDRSARVGRINKLSNAVQAGNLNVIKDNFQISSQNLIDEVNAFSDPAEIVEQLDTLNAFGINVGLTETFRNPVGVRRAAMERYVRSLPLIDGLSALSIELVAESFTGKQLQILRNDLNSKKNTFVANAKFASKALAQVVGVDVFQAFSFDESQTDINAMIDAQVGMSPVAIKDAKDLLTSLFLTKKEGPQKISVEDLDANHAFHEGRMDRVITGYNNLMRSEFSGEKLEDAVLRFSNEGMSVVFDATRLNTKGQFSKDKLIDLTFQMSKINEALFVFQQESSVGTFEKAKRSFDSIFGTSLGQQDLKIPSAIIADDLKDIIAGEGIYEGLSTEHRAVMRSIVISETVKTDDFKKSMPLEEAHKIANTIRSKSSTAFASIALGASGSQAEEIGQLLLNSGLPATEAKQQPNIARLADIIRSGFNQGMTEEAIRDEAREFPGFNDEAFDRAVAAIGATGLSGELGTLQSESGTVSTEISITVTDPRLNDGKPTNIPTLVEGQVNVQRLVSLGQPSNEQVEIAIRRAIDRQADGALLPFFESIEQAEQAAIRRHEREERRTR